jgi:hypothetical protein
VLSRWLSKPPHLEFADAIVVLGAEGVRGNGTLSDASLRRALHGVDLYRRGLAKTIVFTGPQLLPASPREKCALRSQERWGSLGQPFSSTSP